jgi:membrane fusion protein, heavy metal efflux system
MSSRTSLPARTWPAITRYSNPIVGGIIVAAGVALLASFWLGWIDILPYHSQVGDEEQPEQTPAAPNTVELTPEKIAAANLHTTTVRLEPVQPTRAVPGEIKYDAAKRVPINSPVGGIVMEVLVEPAQEVAKDQPLAVLSSREVGEARDEVDKAKADLDLARREDNRTGTIAENVEALLALLQQKPAPESIEATLAQKQLGNYRTNILGAYSRLVLAERRLKDTTDAAGGVLSARIVEERKAAREQAAAQFATECDNARFEAQHEHDKRTADRTHAERMLSVAEQNLSNLLGPFADRRPVTSREHLSELTLLSPIAGRVEKRDAVKASRVVSAGSLFVVADTSTMWVSAEIHERDWPALELVHPGDDLQVRAAALGSGLLTAKVLYVGGEIAPETRSLPLVGELSNADGRLRPGMFVWAHIPLEKPHEALVVPAGAIMRHDNQPFVFVPEGERRFKRVDVKIGLEMNDRIEVESGLAAGDLVVDQGAFFLKSELLLEREE